MGPEQQIMVQKVATKVVDKLEGKILAHTKVVEIEPEPLANQVANLLIEHGIFWWVLGLAAIGAIYVFRKKILDLFDVEVKRKVKA